MAFLTSLFKAALIFIGYYATHIVCAVLLPLPSAAYTVCANIVFLAAVAVSATVQHRSPLKTVGARRMRFSNALAAVGVGVGGSTLVRLAMITIPFPDRWMQSYTERVDAVMQAPGWLLYVSSVFIAPLVEEVVFRGLVYRTLKNGMPIFLAALLSSAAFAVLHGTVMWMLYTFLLALLLVWLYEKTQSLWACILCHTAFNSMGQVSLGGEVRRIAVIVIGIVTFCASVYFIQNKKINAST